MIRIITITIVCNLLAFRGFAQSPGDDCINAIDITYATYNDSIWDGDHQMESFHFENLTVNSPNWGSTNCFGYTDHTSDAYPDIWLKSTLQLSGCYIQGVFVNATDTFQISTYFGTCHDLYQSECYTILPNDSIFENTISLDYIPHDTAHDMFFQIKLPPSALSGEVYMVFYYPFYFFVTYYFQYENPASTGTTSVLRENKVPIAVYPNPANNEIHFESMESIQYIQLISSAGQIVKEKDVNSKESNLDVSNLPSGFYWARIFTEKGFGFSKIIIE